MQTQSEIGALMARLAIADDEFCETLLATVKRLSEEGPDCILPEDATNLAEWIRFIRCVRMCLQVKNF